MDKDQAVLKSLTGALRQNSRIFVRLQNISFKKENLQCVVSSEILLGIQRSRIIWSIIRRKKTVNQIHPRTNTDVIRWEHWNTFCNCSLYIQQFQWGHGIHFKKKIEIKLLQKITTVSDTGQYRDSRLNTAEEKISESEDMA